jgi:hypothetical protein
MLPKGDTALAILSFIFLASVCVLVAFLLKRMQSSVSSNSFAPNSTIRHHLSPEEAQSIRKRLQRQAELAQRDERDRASREMANPSPYEAKLKRREVERLNREEEAERAKNDLRRTDDAQFEKWRSNLRVISDGKIHETAQTKSAKDFLLYIQQAGIVNIESMASVFGLPTQTITRRLLDLEQVGAIYGVLDEGLQFVSLKKREISEIESFLPRSGRYPVESFTNKIREIVLGAQHR